jgi:hypothetical protein
LISTGEEYTLPKSFLAHTTAPSDCLKAITARPGPPTGTITLSRKAMGLDA